MKRLLSNTIIPKEFYIERKADEQLKNTIENMGRPASVLVSRQMGKTNLLLNTKRKLENEIVKFIYIDLSSTTFNEIRDCFRYIIDTAIDTNLELFEEVEELIFENRIKNRLANREHEQELLTLLRHFKGKLIIILDEIDSMVKYNFSDQFFSQIRSVYFASRTNYEEFNNLTYILSGVLEPSEIIQDKTKSPFNISEKIYLNDFTREEYNKFITNINFDFFNDEIIDKIYEWANGHPRMTWDICSNLENIYQENNNLTIKDVDTVVFNLYFKLVSTPPLDNIKQIIKEDTSLAQIILDIKEDIYLNISESTRNKLYLFGVIEINDDDRIVLKNKIIEENLNTEFLKNILYSEISAFDIATKHFNKGSYNEAIVEYGRFLNQEDISEMEKNIAYINAGLCLFYLGNYNQALSHMNEVTVDKEKDPYNYFVNETNKGLVLHSLKEYKKSIKVFNSILEYKDTLMRVRAKLYIAQNYFYLEKGNEKKLFQEHISEAISYINNIIKNDKEENRKKDIIAVLINAYYIKGNYHLEKKEFSEAKKYFNEILEFDINIYKPTIYLCLIDIHKELTEKEEYVNKFFNIITENKLEIDFFNDLKFSPIDIYEYILVLMNLNKSILLNDFLNYCLNTFTELFSSKCEVLLNAGFYFAKENKKETALMIYTYALKFEEKEIAFKQCYKNIYREILEYYFVKNDVENISIAYSKYLNRIIESNLFAQLSKDDMFFLSQPLFKMIRASKKEEVHSAIDKIEKYLFEKLPSDLSLYKVSFIDIKYQLCQDKDNKYEIANSCLEAINKHRDDIKRIPEDFKQYLKTIEKEHHKFVNFTSKIVPKPEQKMPRNEPCPCGSGKKYKKCCFLKSK